MHTPVYVDSIGGETAGGISKNPACGHALPFLDWLFPSSSSSLLWEEQGQQKLHHSECGNEWHDDRQETTDRRAQQIASLFARDFFFFFTPPSLPRPRRECRRGMKKKKNPQ